MRKYQLTKDVNSIFEELFYYIECQLTDSADIEKVKNGNFQNMEEVKNFINEYFLSEIELLFESKIIKSTLRYMIIQKARAMSPMAVYLVELFINKDYPREELIDTLKILETTTNNEKIVIFYLKKMSKKLKIMSEKSIGLFDEALNELREYMSKDFYDKLNGVIKILFSNFCKGIIIFRIFWKDIGQKKLV